jgi:hypothetical protein
MTGQSDRHVVAVVGDGALTGGMTWEALNNITHDNTRNLVIVVNDNGRSYAPTIGGMARSLDRIRTRRSYRNLHVTSRKAFDKLGPTARAIYRGVRGGIRGFLSNFVKNQSLYANLDIKYVGPIDGHNIHMLENALRQAKNYGAPVIVHVITEKGRGYQPARDDTADQFHAVGRIDPETGEPTSSSSPSWTDVFSEEITAHAARNERIVAITAAMLQETQIQWIGSASAGFDHINTRYCNQNQIVFRYAPGSNAHAVADYVMACMVLCQEKRAPKPWHSASVIGVGYVGTSVTHRLQQQGLNPLLYDPIRAQREPGFLGCSLEACLQCDLICLHPALTVSGAYPSQHLINTRNIHLLPTGAVLINASRGEIIEEAALKTRPDLILCLDV